MQDSHRGVNVTLVYDAETIKICQTSAYLQGKGLITDTPKTDNSRRALKLSRSAFLLLHEYKDWQDNQRALCDSYWKDTDNRVFTADDGEPMRPDSLTSWFSKFVKRSGLPHISLHSLRHTCASLLIADGTPLVVASRRLGHSLVSTTSDIYAHVIQSADDKATEMTEKFADVIAAAPALRAA